MSSNHKPNAANTKQKPTTADHKKDDAADSPRGEGGMIGEGEADDARGGMKNEAI